MATCVLIADADPSRRRRLSRTAAGLAYRVLETGSAAEALGLIGSAGVQVVLVGGRLTGMEVDELVRGIRRRYRDVEVLVYVQEPWVIPELKSLVAGFIRRPLDRDLLEVLIDRAAERTAQRRRLREMPREVAHRVEKKVTERMETERFLTVKQIVDKLSAIIGQIARDVEGGVR